MTNDVKPDVLSSAAAVERAPSRLDERKPEVARMIGTIGLVVLGAGVLMWVWNQYRWFNLSFLRFAPMVWWVAGFGCLFFHAARDRALEIRRAYGAMSWFLLALGTTWIALAVLHAWGGWLPAMAASLVWLLLYLGFTVAPLNAELVEESLPAAPPGFLPALRHCAANCLAAPGRWRHGLNSSGEVRMITGLGLVMLVSLWVLGAMLLYLYPAETVFNVAAAALLLGLVFSLVFASNESEAGWRNGMGYVVGLIGGVGVLVAVCSVGTGMLGMPDIAVPHGMMFGLVGLAFLWAHIWIHGADSDIGYRGAVALSILGGVLFAAAFVRSVVPFAAENFFRRYDFRPYLVPSGFVLMTLGLAYLLLGRSLTSDNRVLVIMRRELGAFFYSPIAWIVIGCVGIAAWIAYAGMLFEFFDQENRFQQRQFAEPIISNYLVSLLPLMILILAVPAITMRLLSEEHRAGTLEILFTAPITDAQVVLGKFFAGWLSMIIAWLPWVFFPVAWRFLGGEDFDYRPIMSFYLGCAICGAGFVAIGLFWSSITRSQIIAYLLAAVTLLVMAFATDRLVGLLPIDNQEAKRQVQAFVNYRFHFGEFGMGRIHLSHLVFHGSIAVFWAFLAVRVLESRRWR